MKDPTQTNSTVQNENSVIIYPTLMLMESFMVYKTFLELRRKTAFSWIMKKKKTTQESQIDLKRRFKVQ